MTKHRYLKELAARRAMETDKQHIVLAMLPGFAAALYGTLGYLAGSSLSDASYLALLLAGLVLLTIAFTRPGLMARPSRVVRLITGKLGHYIFAALLTLLYFVLFVPLGIIARRRAPLYQEWEKQPPCPVWLPKTTLTLIPEGHKGQGSLLSNAFIVLHYFASHGNWMLIPVLIILLTLGIVMFFAQTSALAPFIYTLF